MTAACDGLLTFSPGNPRGPGNPEEPVGPLRTKCNEQVRTPTGSDEFISEYVPSLHLSPSDQVGQTHQLDPGETYHAVTMWLHVL